ncbi:MAG: hypothetical protein II878_01635 [Bacteroidales bacterium]|nr:hypothetical protein [Bacteroidales bacterium]
MRRIVLLFVAICLSITLFAQKEETDVKANAVTMVSFVQDSPFRDATITLKNNLDIPVTSIKARIVYKDMNGEILDYQDIDKSIEIAPKMARTFTVKPFGGSADYVYYKSRSIGHDRKFKVDFVLEKYNEEKVQQPQTDTAAKEIDEDGDDDDDEWAGLYIFICFLLGVAICIIFYFVIPYKMAKDRGRSAGLWILLGFIISPLLVYIILAIIGDSDEKKREELIREMERRK